MKISRRHLRNIILEAIFNEGTDPKKSGYQPSPHPSTVGRRLEIDYQDLPFLDFDSKNDPDGYKLISGASISQSLDEALEAAKPFLKRGEKVFYVKTKRGSSTLEEVLELFIRNDDLEHVYANVRNGLTPRRVIELGGVLFFHPETPSNPNRLHRI